MDGNKGVSGFFAQLFRMKYIARWGLMNSTRTENLAEHSLEVALIAHVLAVTGNTLYGRDYDEGRVSIAAMYHDASEIFTGDLPTPIKYYSPDIKKAYKDIEKAAAKRLSASLPEEIADAFAPYLGGDIPEGEERLIKCADKLAAYIKCLSEQNAGNREFDTAAVQLKSTIDGMALPEAEYFRQHFLPAFRLTLDEIEGVRGEDVK